MEKVYLAELEALKALAESLPTTRMLSLARVSALVLLNMRYERIMLDRDLPTHPYPLVANLVREASAHLRAWSEVAFVEEGREPLERDRPAAMEESHHDLFQKLWVKFSPDEYRARIDRYVHRLRVNGLADGWARGMRCIDFGCGHGNFAHALLAAGAELVVGVDYGEESVAYAEAARDRLGVSPDRLRFRVATVYDVGEPDAGFDLAVQNGVFHHLEDEPAALSEVARVVRPGGWLWYYTDGAGAISHDLWDASVQILANVPTDLTLDYLRYLNLGAGKRYHLGDSLHAVYGHSTLEEVEERLRAAGFGCFRRLVGGYPTDFDHDVIAKDRWGREKFGCGDLRVLARRLQGAHQ
ncbi:MAG: class I SAM-dependent methyltransferase [Chthonomonadales bacterium]|nr:class I SAM-dependent methyltransferase [Chthonomonadales bacterium]